MAVTLAVIPPRALPAEGDFAVLAADVGQGNAVLVRTRGHLLVYDAGPQYTRAFEQTFVDLSKQHRTAFLPFLLQPVAADRRNFQDDNMHPTAAAQPKLRDYVWTGLKPLLK